jgi:hypothetical protein
LKNLLKGLLNLKEKELIYLNKIIRYLKLHLFVEFFLFKKDKIYV